MAVTETQIGIFKVTIQKVMSSEKLARDLGYQTVAREKRAVAGKIAAYIEQGGFLFAMCSATDSLDVALASLNVDIVAPEIDGTPVEPNYQKKLDLTKTIAFENFTVYPDPYKYEYSDIDVSPYRTSSPLQESFELFQFSAKFDPIPTMLTQNHTAVVPGFFGQTTSFRKSTIKKEDVVMGSVLNSDRAKYIYGGFGKGLFSFYGGHDPEDYQHFVGDPPTNLSLHKNSPGYRLILNNVLFPSAKKKKRKT